MVWPSPLNVPVKAVELPIEFPIGTKPAPLFHPLVAAASMLLPRA